MVVAVSPLCHRAALSAREEGVDFTCDAGDVLLAWRFLVCVCALDAGCRKEKVADYASIMRHSEQK